MTAKACADDALKYASQIECVAVSICNLIREVGYGNLSADNALHQMVECYKTLTDVAEWMTDLSDDIENINTKGGDE